MSEIKAKKYSFTALTLISFLLLTLSGCDTTSDPKVYYQATGSWQGKIGADQVRGIIAPDNTCHLAIVDAAGNSVGEYVGAIGSVDVENIGGMTLTRLHATESTGAPQQFTFKLSADRLFSLQGIELTPTGEASGPADQDDVKGHWSLSALDNTTEVVIKSDGTLSGNDGFCNYSGSLKLQPPLWNIYSLDLTISDNTYLSCSLDKVTYSGLAMRLNTGDLRPHLWFAANSGAKTFFGEWSETENVAPVAAMAILGEREKGSVLVQEGSVVALDAQSSSDANNDILTYAWSGTALDGIPLLNIQGTGSAVTFIPLSAGSHSLTLTVSDGIATNTLTRQILVEWTPDRFVDCTNGTVLDTKTNLLWLQDAGCTVLNQGTVWGVSHLEAVTRVGTLASGVCSLNDNSAQGNWRLPTLNDFSYIVPRSQWSEGNRFANVGPYYWTADPDPLTANNWFFVNVSYVDPANWFESYFENNATAVWPVRALRLDEQCPPVP